MCPRLAKPDGQGGEWPTAQEEPTPKEQTSRERLSPWKPSWGSREAASGTQWHTPAAGLAEPQGKSCTIPLFISKHGLS